MRRVVGKEYLVIDLRTDVFSAVFSDGRRVEAAYISHSTNYSWDGSCLNCYTAETADGNLYIIAYRLVPDIRISTFGRIDAISVCDAYNNVRYELRTEYWFENLNG